MPATNNTNTDEFAVSYSKKYVTNQLSYPKDLSSAGAGHYIQFFINEQENANINFGGSAPTQISGSAMGGGGGTSTLSVPRSATKRIADSIALYMPATVSLSQESKYGEQEIGGAVAAAIAGYKGYEEGDGFFNTIGTTSAGTFGAIGEAAGNTFKQALDAGASGAKAAQQIAAGKVFNSRMEVMFEGISRREFSFTFKLMPKSKEEAQNVDRIVRTFRFYMAPSFDGDASLSRTFIVPATFDIEYYYSGGRNNFLNRISTSVLKQCNVTFGGERVQFYKPLGRGAPPVETQIELQFQELEVITREKIKEGF